MNAFTKPLQSLARQLQPTKVLKRTSPNPSYHGFYVDNAKASQTDSLRLSKPRKASI